jgi:glutamate racemase
VIGIFDSGLGGLTVARAIMDALPGYDMIYFGDTARTPYGAKSAATVEKYAMEDTRLLLERGATIIVIACNSASSVAAESVVREFHVPVFEVITPAVEMATTVSKSGAIGVIGTRATIASGIYERKIIQRRSGAKVYSVACPLLVPLVEEGWIKKPETAMIIRKYLRPLKTKQIDTLILGCTHYPILKATIQQKIGKRVKTIDSASVVAQAVKQYISGHPESTATLSIRGETRFFVSDVTEQFKKTAQMVLNKHISLEHISL